MQMRPGWRIPVLRRIAQGAPYFRGKDRLFAMLLSGMGPTMVDFGGPMVELDLSDTFERLAAVGLYQPELLTSLRQYLQPGDCFVDCGAHLGLLALPLAVHLGPGGDVFAFEPAGRTHARLVKNLAGLPPGGCRMEVVPAALGARTGTAELLVSSQHGWSTMSPSAALVGRGRGRAIAEKSQVDVTTLDEYFLAGGRRLPDAVKIDVEGWEEEVLKGGQRLLGSHPPKAVVVERNERILAAMGRSWQRTEALMREMGFEVSEELRSDVVFRPVGA